MPEWVDGSLVAGAGTGLVAMVVALVRMWGRLGQIATSLDIVNKRLDALHTHVVDLRDAQRGHEIKCAGRDGRTEERFKSLEKQIDTYSDGRWDALISAVKEKKS